MKPFDENELIAYHLQELPPRRARALEKAMRADPSLAAESKIYAEMLRSFKRRTPLDLDEEVVERNWSRLWATLPRRPLRPRTRLRWIIPALTGAGLAFAATSFFITTHHHAVAPATDWVHQSKEMAQSRPSTENPVEGNVLPEEAGNDSRDMHKGLALPAIPHTHPPTQRRYPVPPRIISSARGRLEPAPVLQFIPLARTPLPLPPEPELPHIALAPTSVPQVTEANAPSEPKHPHSSIHRDHPMDVTLAMGGMLVGTRGFTNNGATHSQGATHAVSAAASFHQQLRPALGYRIAVSYSRPDFLYSSGAGQTDINGRLYEVAGTYVLQGPHRGIVSTTVEGGAGIMAVLPSVKSSGTGKNMRGAAIVGVSAEFAVSKHLAIQTSYRMQVFKGPDFQSTGTIVPITTTTLISNEPMVGITYRFSHQ